MSHYAVDAVVVGAGPNGLAAAITLARAGCSVLVVEGASTIGGGTRSVALTLPGFVHDVCSAIHPLGVASPFFRTLPLSEYGLRWVYSPAELAHPIDGEPTILLKRAPKDSAPYLGPDGPVWRAMFGTLAARYPAVLHEFLGPLRPPRYPVSMAFFGALALFSASRLARTAFRGHQAQALFGGMASHATMPLEWPATAAFGLMLGMLAHGVGWPLAVGGSQQISEAMAGYLRSLGGEIVTKRPITALSQLPSARAVLLDVSPRGFLEMAGDDLPVGYRRTLERYRFGPGVFKMDFALSGPIPWRDPAAAQAATVHIGGRLEEIRRTERAVWQGQHAAQPFVLLAQQSLFDPSRAPVGHHVAWAYCHVPHGSEVDMSDAILSQIERFAPRFQDVILATHTHNAAQMAAYNPNYVGGDINGGVQDLLQLFTRPAPRLNPYSTPLKGVYMCSSATPPGGGVHGMAGYYAARAALRKM